MLLKSVSRRNLVGTVGADGIAYATKLDGRATWSKVSGLAGEGWGHVDGMFHPESLVLCGKKGRLGHFDLRTGCVQSCGKFSSSGLTTALASLPDSSVLGRCSLDCVELYDQRYLVRPFASWQHCQHHTRSLDTLWISASSSVSYCCKSIAITHLD